MNIKFFVGYLLATLAPYAAALDTDLYKETMVPPEPKILLLLDTSGSMRCSGDRNQTEFSGFACASMVASGGKLINTGSGIVDTGLYTNAQPAARMKSIQDILTAFIDPNSPDAWPDSYHVGLSVFSNPGSAVIRPIKPLGVTDTDEIGNKTVVINGQTQPLTARNLLMREIKAVSGSGLTPTLGAIFEAAMYMSSQPVVTASSRTYNVDANWLQEQNFPAGSVANWTRQQNHRIAHPDSFTGGTIMPLRNGTSACLRAMQQYGPEYGRFTDACGNETITATGQLRYLGPEDSPQACSNGDKHIILITDGFPQASSGNSQVRDNERLAVWMRRFLTDNMAATGEDPRCPYSAESDNLDAWLCMRSIVKKLKDSHNTTTHVISFLADNSTSNNLSPNNKQLQALANASGGSFYLAQRPEEIKLAIQEIAVTATNSASFASPTIAVDNFNPFAHQNMVNYSLFRPSNSNFWYGNLKRYRLAESNGNSQVVDKNDKPAFDLTTGEFNTGITSFWSSAQDGNNILLGGAASNLRTGTNIPIFTDFAKGNSNCKNALNNGANLRLVSGCKDGIQEYLFARAMIGRNSANAQDVTDATDDANHWYKWLTGIDHLGREWNFMQKTIPADDLPAAPAQIGDSDRVRKWMGAPLHTSPFVVNYKTISGAYSNTATNNNISERVFISSNDGFLYGFTAGTGAEVFRFYPEPLLNKIKNYTSYSNGDITFGLDGQWTLWREDADDDKGFKNGVISAADGDKIAIFGGMRRGGDYYYGLDLTNLQTPKIIFKLHGAAEGKTPTDPALARLGQSWSKPELINVKINGKAEVLMAIGGGYDTRYDPPQKNQPITYNPGENGNTLGNAIYLIYTEGSNAGKIAAWVSANANSNNGHVQTDMRYAIPARLATLDLNYDGFTDYIYAADLAGQIFRIDLNNAATTASELITRATTLGKFGVTAGNYLKIIAAFMKGHR